jgi:hypothetical protein
MAAVKMLEIESSESGLSYSSIVSAKKGKKLTEIENGKELSTL